MRRCLALLSILTGAVLASAQTLVTRPAFDVTSVKPRSGGDQALVFRGDPGGVHVEAPLDFLIRFAYGVQDYQLEGGPSWIHSEFYVVDGKTTGRHSPQELRRMFQTLLEDRFALKMHPETKEGSIYSLVVTRKGSKMKPWVQGSCVDGGDKQLPSGATPCGYRPGTGTLESKGVSVPALATFLSAVMGRPVVDKTGLTGRFDFHLDYKIDQATAGFIGAPESQANDDRPSIFSALQEQLGLQLKSDKGPRDYVVIDRVEKPSEN